MAVMERSLKKIHEDVLKELNSPVTSDPNELKQSLENLEKLAKEVNYYKEEYLDNRSFKKNIEDMEDERLEIRFSIQKILLIHMKRFDNIKNKRARHEEILDKQKDKFYALSPEEQVSQWNIFFNERDKKRDYFELRADRILTKSDFLAHMETVKKIKQAYEQINPFSSNKVVEAFKKIKELEEYWNQSFLRQKSLNITQIKEIFTEQRKVNEERKILLKKAREIIELGDLIEESDPKKYSSMNSMDLKREKEKEKEKEKEQKAFYQRIVTLLNQIEKTAITREIKITLDEKLEKKLNEFHELPLNEQTKQYAPFWSKRNKEIDIAWLKIDIASARIDFLDDLEAIKKIKQDYSQLDSFNSNHVTSVLGKIKKLEDDWNQLLWYEYNADKIPIEEMSDTRKKVKEESNNFPEKIREIVRLANLSEEEKSNLTSSGHSSDDEKAKVIIKKMFQEKIDREKKELKIKKEKELNPSSFSYSIKDLPALYKKLQHCVDLLTALEKLVHLRITIDFRNNRLKYAKIFQKTAHVSDTISEIEENVRAYLLGLEKSWDSFSRQEKQQINAARDLLIKNSIRGFDLKKELVAYKEKNSKNKHERSADEEKKYQERYPFVKDLKAIRQSSQGNLEKVHGKWLMQKERIEKEEELINQWLFSCRQELNDEDYSESDAITAIDYLEKWYIYGEWVLFDKKRYEYLLLKKKSDQYKEIITICEFIQDKIRNLSNRIYAIFGNQIETVRKMIDKKEIVVKQTTLSENIKSFESFLEKMEQGCLEQKTLEELLDLQETFNLSLKKCDFALSNASLLSHEREQYQQVLTLIQAVQKCVTVEIKKKNK